MSLANREDGQHWFAVPNLSDIRASSGRYIPSISEQIDRLLPSVQVKRFFVSEKLTSSNNNELQKVCEEFMVDESTCNSFVQHQEFLALTAQKRAAEGKTLPNIDWNDEREVSSLTANKLRVYLKQHHLQVSGGKAALVARVLRYVRAVQDALKNRG